MSNANPIRKMLTGFRTWHCRRRSIRSPPLMKRWLSALLLLLIPLSALRAQLPTFGEMPVDINSDQTHFEGGVAIAEGNLTIQYGAVTIYADYGEYHPDTHDV